MYILIKLENIIYNTVSGQINLIDFEINSLTESYISPELINKYKKPDVKTSLWAVGIITYVLLFGKYPFENKKDILCDRIITEEDLDLDISDNCKKFITRCLYKNYTKRINMYNTINHNWFKSEHKNSNVRI